MKMKAILAAAVLTVSASAVAQDYNRAGVTYDNTKYSYNKEAGDKDDNFSTNGFGLNYVHGFSISKSAPMFIETGLNLNFGFYSDTKKYDGDKYTNKFNNVNLQLPVNYVYKFAIGDNMAIAPYAGINFKLHLSSTGKYIEEEDGDKEEEKWNVFDKKDMGDDGTWNRFQMGWQVGVGFEYNAYYVGVQYGTDFIPAFKYEKAKINTGNLRIALAYKF